MSSVTSPELMVQPLHGPSLGLFRNHLALVELYHHWLEHLAQQQWQRPEQPAAVVDSEARKKSRR